LTKGELPASLSGYQGFWITPVTTNDPHDDKAVRVDIDGMTVGHLSREEARSFRRRPGQKHLTGQATTCNAALIGGFIMEDRSRAFHGVQLDIMPFGS
jgi:hypothetical protein